MNDSASKVQDGIVHDDDVEDDDPPNGNKTPSMSRNIMHKLSSWVRDEAFSFRTRLDVIALLAVLRTPKYVAKILKILVRGVTSTS